MSHSGKRGGNLIPGVAKGFAANDQKNVHTFALRTSAEWSNGDPVIAAPYVGNVMEIGTAQQVIGSPQHEYRQKWIASVPIPDPRKEMARREVRRAFSTAK